jgi:hypothetical protein
LLLARLEPRREASPQAREAIRLIQASHGRVTVRWLADQLSLSISQLERSFTRHIDSGRSCWPVRPTFVPRPPRDGATARRLGPTRGESCRGPWLDVPSDRAAEVSTQGAIGHQWLSRRHPARPRIRRGCLLSSVHGAAIARSYPSRKPNGSRSNGAGRSNLTGYGLDLVLRGGRYKI